MQTRIEQLTPYRPLDIPPLEPNPITMPPVLPSIMPTLTVYEKPRWEYKFILRTLVLSEEELNSLGAEGWELAAAVNDGSSINFYFKRSAC